MPGRSTRRRRKPQYWENSDSESDSDNDTTMSNDYESDGEYTGSDDKGSYSESDVDYTSSDDEGSGSGSDSESESDSEQDMSDVSDDESDEGGGSADEMEVGDGHDYIVYDDEGGEPMDMTSSSGDDAQVKLEGSSGNPTPQETSINAKKQYYLSILKTRSEVNEAIEREEKDKGFIDQLYEQAKRRQGDYHLDAMEDPEKYEELTKEVNRLGALSDDHRKIILFLNKMEKDKFMEDRNHEERFQHQESVVMMSDHGDFERLFALSIPKDKEFSMHPVNVTLGSLFREHILDHLKKWLLDMESRNKLKSKRFPFFFGKESLLSVSAIQARIDEYNDVTKMNDSNHSFGFVELLFPDDPYAKGAEARVVFQFDRETVPITVLTVGVEGFVKLHLPNGIAKMSDPPSSENGPGMVSNQSTLSGVYYLITLIRYVSVLFTFGEFGCKAFLRPSYWTESQENDLLPLIPLFDMTGDSSPRESSDALKTHLKTSNSIDFLWGFPNVGNPQFFCSSGGQTIEGMFYGNDSLFVGEPDKPNVLVSSRELGQEIQTDSLLHRLSAENVNRLKDAIANKSVPVHQRNLFTTSYRASKLSFPRISEIINAVELGLDYSVYTIMKSANDAALEDGNQKRFKPANASNLRRMRVQKNRHFKATYEYVSPSLPPKLTASKRAYVDVLKHLVKGNGKERTIHPMDKKWIRAIIRDPSRYVSRHGNACLFFARDEKYLIDKTCKFVSIHIGMVNKIDQREDVSSACIGTMTQSWVFFTPPTSVFTKPSSVYQDLMPNMKKYRDAECKEEIEAYEFPVYPGSLEGMEKLIERFFGSLISGFTLSRTMEDTYYLKNDPSSKKKKRRASSSASNQRYEMVHYDWTSEESQGSSPSSSWRGQPLDLPQGFDKFCGTSYVPLKWQNHAPKKKRSIVKKKSSEQESSETGTLPEVRWDISAEQEDNPRKIIKKLDVDFFDNWITSKMDGKSLPDLHPSIAEYVQIESSGVQEYDRSSSPDAKDWNIINDLKIHEFATKPPNRWMELWMIWKMGDARLKVTFDILIRDSKKKDQQRLNSQQSWNICGFTIANVTEGGIPPWFDVASQFTLDWRWNASRSSLEATPLPEWAYQIGKRLFCMPVDSEFMAGKVPLDFDEQCKKIYQNQIRCVIILDLFESVIRQACAPDASIDFTTWFSKTKDLNAGAPILMSCSIDLQPEVVVFPVTLPSPGMVKTLVESTSRGPYDGLLKDSDIKYLETLLKVQPSLNESGGRRPLGNGSIYSIQTEFIRSGKEVHTTKIYLENRLIDRVSKELRAEISKKMIITSESTQEQRRAKMEILQKLDDLTELYGKTLIFERRRDWIRLHLPKTCVRVESKLQVETIWKGILTEEGFGTYLPQTSRNSRPGRSTTNELFQRNYHIKMEGEQQSNVHRDDRNDPQPPPMMSDVRGDPQVKSEGSVHSTRQSSRVAQNRAMGPFGRGFNKKSPLFDIPEGSLYEITNSESGAHLSSLKQRQTETGLDPLFIIQMILDLVLGFGDLNGFRTVALNKVGIQVALPHNRGFVDSIEWIISASAKEDEKIAEVKQDKDESMMVNIGEDAADTLIDTKINEARNVANRLILVDSILYQDEYLLTLPYPSVNLLSSYPSSEESIFMGPSEEFVNTIVQAARTYRQQRSSIENEVTSFLADFPTTSQLLPFREEDDYDADDRIATSDTYKPYSAPENFAFLYKMPKPRVQKAHPHVQFVYHKPSLEAPPSPAKRPSPSTSSNNNNKNVPLMHRPTQKSSAERPTKSDAPQLLIQIVKNPELSIESATTWKVADIVGSKGTLAVQGEYWTPKEIRAELESFDDNLLSKWALKAGMPWITRQEVEQFLGGLSEKSLSPTFSKPKFDGNILLSPLSWLKSSKNHLVSLGPREDDQSVFANKIRLALFLTEVKRSRKSKSSSGNPLPLYVLDSTERAMILDQVETTMPPNLYLKYEGLKATNFNIPEKLLQRNVSTGFFSLENYYSVVLAGLVKQDPTLRCFYFGKLARDRRAFDLRVHDLASKISFNPRRGIRVKVSKKSGKEITTEVISLMRKERYVPAILPLKERGIFFSEHPQYWTHPAYALLEDKAEKAFVVQDSSDGEDEIPGVSRDAREKRRKKQRKRPSVLAGVKRESLDRVVKDEILDTTNIQEENPAKKFKRTQYRYTCEGCNQGAIVRCASCGPICSDTNCHDHLEMYYKTIAVLYPSFKKPSVQSSRSKSSSKEVQQSDTPPSMYPSKKVGFGFLGLAAVGGLSYLWGRNRGRRQGSRRSARYDYDYDYVQSQYASIQRRFHPGGYYPRRPILSALIGPPHYGYYPRGHRMYGRGRGRGRGRGKYRRFGAKIPQGSSSGISIKRRQNNNTGDDDDALFDNTHRAHLNGPELSVVALKRKRDLMHIPVKPRFRSRK